MAEFWLVPATEDNPTGLALNDDDELIICDDCPCGCAETYQIVGTVPALGSGWTATITNMTGTSTPCTESGTWYMGLMTGTGPFASSFNGDMITVYGNPSVPTSWVYIAYTTAAGCGQRYVGTILGAGNSCPDGSYSGVGPSDASTAVIS